MTLKDENLRLTCLDMATRGPTVKSITDVAQEYYDFVKKMNVAKKTMKGKTNAR